MLLLSLSGDHTTSLFRLCLCQILMACYTYTFWYCAPRDINDLFIRWSKIANQKYNSLLLTAASALCWAIWLTRNEVVFDKCKPKSFLQVLFRGTHWLRQWARLQRHDDQRDQLILVGQHLESSAPQFFSSNGWLSTRRLGYV